LIELWTIAGTIYYDEEDNDDLNNGNPWLSGQIVSLSGTDLNGNGVNISIPTQSDGSYLFTWLYAWDYEVSYVNSSAYIVDSAQAWSMNDSRDYLLWWGRWWWVE